MVSDGKGPGGRLDGEGTRTTTTSSRRRTSATLSGSARKGLWIASVHGRDVISCPPPAATCCCMFAFARSAPVNLLRSESPCGRLRSAEPPCTSDRMSHTTSPTGCLHRLAHISESQQQDSGPSFSKRKLPSETHPLVEHWALTARTGLRFSSSKNATSVEPNLLVIGSCSSTYQLGQVVFKIRRINEEAEITQQNAKANDTEASVYRILEVHDRVLPGQKAFRLEDPSHFMPRDSCEDNSVRSDLFALASALYGIEFGSLPLRTRMTRQLLSVLGRERFHRCRISC
ncbi:hypothetical protein KC360_g157 [Hortaea werneckii]|nr:hypothetical protein KC360_g157 [Hortaea werneckii]